MEVVMEMAANQFRVKFFELIDQIAETGQEITITKHGRPVAKVIPAEAARSFVGCMAGTAEILGDLVAPALDPLDLGLDPEFGGVP